MRHFILILILAMALGGCAHYSTTMDKPGGSVVNAPIERTWTAAVAVLDAEGVKVKAIDDVAYTIEGDASLSVWSLATAVWVKLHPDGDSRTVLYVTAGPKMQLMDWGHSKRLARDLFRRIKTRAEQ